jgi:hypothetical protein
MVGTVIKYVYRTFSLSEADDFDANVKPHLSDDRRADPIMRLPPGCYIAGRESLVGWEIKFKE